MAIRVTLLNVATGSEKHSSHSFVPWPSNRCFMGRGRRTVGTDDMAGLTLAARKMLPPSMASHFISTFLQKTSLALEIKLLSCWQINSPLILAVSPATFRWRTAQLMSSDIIHQITRFTRPIWSGWQAARGSSSGCAQIKRGARLPFISIWRYCTLRHWLKISSCWSYTAVFTSQIPSMDENRLSWE